MLIGFTSSLTAAVLGEAPPLPPPPGPAQPGMQFAGRSVGGIRVNAARAFCGGGHRRWGSSVLPTSISLKEGTHRDISHSPDGKAQAALHKAPIRLTSSLLLSQLGLV